MLFNPGNPHSTPVGTNGNPFRCGVPLFWKLSYRINEPITPEGILEYDIVLAFDYPEYESGLGATWRWRAAIESDKYLISAAGDNPNLSYDDLILSISNRHDWQNWILFVDGFGWHLTEGVVEFDSLGANPQGTIEYSLLDFDGVPTSQIQGLNCDHDYFAGLQSNVFAYVRGLISGGEVIEEWRPDITIEPFWP